jgi:hypothetical protein
MQTPSSQQQMEQNQHQHYHHDHHGFDLQHTHHFHALGVDTGQGYPGEITGQQYSQDGQQYVEDNGQQFTGLSLDHNDLKTMNPLDSFANMI